MNLWPAILIVVFSIANLISNGTLVYADAAVAKTATDQAILTVDEILNRDPDLEDYVVSQRCIQRNNIRRTEVLDERHVAVQVSRDEYYIVQFKHRCPGMRRGNPVMLETRSTRLCKHDSLRPLEDWGGAMRPGVRCLIPEFQSVTKEQLLHLKDSLKAERRKKKV